MHIICPHCTTTYAIDLDTLGTSGRTVRCSRCRQVWLARPEHALAGPEALAVTADGAAARSWVPAGSAAEAPKPPHADETPLVESPSISADLPSHDEVVAFAQDSPAAEPPQPAPARRLRRTRRLPSFSLAMPRVSLATACAGMGALALALLIWRNDMVRLLPQTAGFYKLVGLDVNLRGLAFKDVKVTNENVEGKPVLVIEGVIVGEAKKTVELPRLRFSVRDAQGAEIYAWNAVLEQPMLKPGEKAWFKSRLASPPPEGRNIDVRFFSKRDVAAGGV
jgi:predicted Zn finger-like uncharacterized protein